MSCHIPFPGSKSIQKLLLTINKFFPGNFERNHGFGMKGGILHHNLWKEDFDVLTMPH